MSAVVAVSKAGFTPYGQGEEAFYSREPEIMLSGPYDTGKTLTLLQKMNVLAAIHPNSRLLFVRKTYKSLISSVVATWEKKIHDGRIGIDAEYPITKYGGEKPEWYDYPNGSRIVLGGLDNPMKTLSTEYDYIYVSQSEELTEDEWQALTRAASGRAGNAPYTQVMGDCNPDVPEHWILSRKRLGVYESRHEDNPTIFERDKNGKLTGKFAPGGKERMDTLDALTGVRYKRGRLGLWVGREGQVYEFDPAVHLINERDLPEFKARYRVFDFGYANPFVCQWWGEDYDGRLYLYREIYMSQRTVATHAQQIRRIESLAFWQRVDDEARVELFKSYPLDELSEDDKTAVRERGIGELWDKWEQTGQGKQRRLWELLGCKRAFVNIADHDAEDRATLQENGIKTKAADKRISVGIEKVEERLKVQPDGRPRLFIVRDCTVEIDGRMYEQRRPTSTQGEYGGYVWPTTKAGRAADERPIKSDDHGMDAKRYMVMHLDGKKVREARIL